MNNQQFIYWLNGFIDAVGEKGPTPKQWETIVSELGKVGETIVYPTYTPNTIPSGPIPRNPFDNPYWYKNPSDINKVTCEGNTVLTATTGSGTVYGAFGSITTNGNTSVTAKIPENSTLTIGNTVTTLPKGTTLNYTANLPEDL